MSGMSLVVQDRRDRWESISGVVWILFGLLKKIAV